VLVSRPEVLYQKDANGKSAGADRGMLWRFRRTRWRGSWRIWRAQAEITTMNHHGSSEHRGTDSDERLIGFETDR